MASTGSKAMRMGISTKAWRRRRHAVVALTKLAQKVWVNSLTVRVVFNVLVNVRVRMTASTTNNDMAMTAIFRRGSSITTKLLVWVAYAILSGPSVPIEIEHGWPFWIEQWPNNAQLAYCKAYRIVTPFPRKKNSFLLFVSSAFRCQLNTMQMHFGILLCFGAW